MKKKIAYLFDMDGVIVDNNQFHIEAWIEFGKKHNMSITKHDILPLFGKKNEEILKIFFDNPLSEKMIKQLAAEKEKLYRDIFASSIKPADGLPELLENMKRNNIPAAVATAGPLENLNFVLDKINIRKYFSAFVYDEQVKNGKPHPEIFLKAAELLNYPPQNCIVFEDSYHGITAAKRANMKVIAITTTYAPEKLKEADLIIPNFKALTISKINAL